MPYLIFPVPLFILDTTFPARAFSVYLLLPLLNLLNLFFLLTYEIHKLPELHQTLISHWIFFLDILNPHTPILSCIYICLLFSCSKNWIKDSILFFIWNTNIWSEIFTLRILSGKHLFNPIETDIDHCFKKGNIFYVRLRTRLTHS